MIKKILAASFIVFFLISGLQAQDKSGFVAVMPASTMILPGTSEYLKSSIKQAHADGAKLLILKLDTPGGLLNTTQEMIQEIFSSPVPVVVYVAPSGATATSAGVFITLAAHVAVMAPGTTIGAAHPVSGEGKDIEGDMRSKVENMTIAMVKSISEQRGRNVTWAEKSVKDSSSLTEKEALKERVVDFIAQDYEALLKSLAGKKVKLQDKDVVLEDYSSLERREYEMSFKQKTINTLSNPNVLAMLWLAATTALSIELYNPGAILPGVVGVICLVLALAMSQVIPITQGGIILLILGAAMIASELFITSGVLGVGGVIAIIFGSIYLIDTVEAPGLSVSLEFIIPTALALGSLMLFLVYSIAKSARKKEITGEEAMVGQTAEALGNFTSKGKVFVNGEVWNAEMQNGIAEKGEKLKILEVKDGLILLVEKK